MVNGNIETYQKLIDSAKNEFKTKGYDNSSIRSIASGAGLTIGALYQHFDNKEDLFNHIVSPVIKGFISLSNSNKADFINILESGNLHAISERTSLYAQVFLEYIFGNWDIFKILISDEKLQIYENFFNTIVKTETEMTILMIEKANLKLYKHLSYEKLFILVSAQYRGIFALMRSEDNLENLHEDLILLFEFFKKAWNGMMGSTYD